MIFVGNTPKTKPAVFDDWFHIILTHFKNLEKNENEGSDHDPGSSLDCTSMVREIWKKTAAVVKCSGTRLLLRALGAQREQAVAEEAVEQDEHRGDEHQGERRAVVELGALQNHQPEEADDGEQDINPRHALGDRLEQIVDGLLERVLRAGDGDGFVVGTAAIVTAGLHVRTSFAGNDRVRGSPDRVMALRPDEEGLMTLPWGITFPNKVSSNSPLFFFQPQNVKN